MKRRAETRGRPELSPLQRARRSAFGAKIRAEREAAGLSREDLAAILLVSPHAIARIEDGEGSFPAELLADLGRALGTTGSRLLGEHANLIRGVG